MSSGEVTGQEPNVGAPESPEAGEPLPDSAEVVEEFSLGALRAAFAKPPEGLAPGIAEATVERQKSKVMTGKTNAFGNIPGTGQD